MIRGADGICVESNSLVEWCSRKVNVCFQLPDTRASVVVFSAVCLSIAFCSDTMAGHGIFGFQRFERFWCLICRPLKLDRPHLNVIHFSFNLLRVNALYMFRALLAYPQESLHK
jgi:hypothetical protein